jgi:hypothetical protein
VKFAPSPKLPGLIGFLLLMVIGVIGDRQYSSEVAAWNNVHESLTRLSSGISYEPIIALRSKIADTDAVLKIYESKPHIFVRGRYRTLESARRGLQYMDMAIENAHGHSTCITTFKLRL